jgi:hypothetical protein
MKKLNNSLFGAKSASENVVTAQRLEKLQADGKWLWIFKRGASWITLICLFYGVGAFFVPSFFNFQPAQFLILSGMFVGFLVNSIFEWSKLEQSFQQKELN